MMRPDLAATFDPQPQRLRFSVDDYYKMIDLGILDGREKTEIFDGQLIKKITIGDSGGLDSEFAEQRYRGSPAASRRYLPACKNF